MKQECSGVRTDLLAQSLSHHGPQLLRLLPHELHLDDEACLGRSREWRQPEGVGQHEEHLLGFIAQRAELLFSDRLTIRPPGILCHDDRTPDKRFFELAKPGQLVYGCVSFISSEGLFIDILCLDSAAHLSRFKDDLHIVGFCPDQMLPASPAAVPVGSYVTAVIMDLNEVDRRLTVSMKDMELPRLRQGTIRFTPDNYDDAMCRSGQHSTYNEYLSDHAHFMNPSLMEQVASDLGIDFSAGGLSFMSSLRFGRFEEKLRAPQLMQRQLRSLAQHHITRGIKHIKAKQFTEALQSFNQALNIQKDNVDALVGKGALYANLSSPADWIRAVKCFEQALQLDAAHKNAKKYLCEILIVLAEHYEDERRLPEAKEAYHKVLSVDAEHAKATQSLSRLIQAQASLPASSPTINSSCAKDVVGAPASDPPRSSSASDGSSHKTSHSHHKKSHKRSSKKKRVKKSSKRRKKDKRRHEDSDESESNWSSCSDRRSLSQGGSLQQDASSPRPGSRKGHRHREHSHGSSRRSESRHKESRHGSSRHRRRRRRSDSSSSSRSVRDRSQRSTVSQKAGQDGSWSSRRRHGSRTDERDGSPVLCDAKSASSSISSSQWSSRLAGNKAGSQPSGSSRRSSYRDDDLEEWSRRRSCVAASGSEPAAGPQAKPEDILPGASSVDDIESFVHQFQKAKKDLLKKALVKGHASKQQ